MPMAMCMAAEVMPSRGSDVECLAVVAAVLDDERTTRCDDRIAEITGQPTDWVASRGSL